MMDCRVKPGNDESEGGFGPRSPPCQDSRRFCERLELWFCFVVAFSDGKSVPTPESSPTVLSLPGLTRQSIFFAKPLLAKWMDARVKPGHDGRLSAGDLLGARDQRRRRGIDGGDDPFRVGALDRPDDRKVELL